MVPLAAMAAQIHTFIQFLPGPGYDSTSTRKGCIFSGGERKRENKERVRQWPNDDTTAITQIGKEEM